MDGGIGAALAAFARALPSHQVENVARLIAQVDEPDSVVQSRLCELVPNPRFQDQVGTLLKAWRLEPTTTGAAVATGLRAASIAVCAERADHGIEVVWTGPSVAGIPVRYTHGVLVELIGAASERLTLVSFAAYKTEAVTSALRLASEQGVAVRLVLDGGTDAEAAFRTLGDDVQLFTWPPTLLPRHDLGHASLHAKAAIADRHIAFVTSANLTGHALDRNMELGLLITGGAVPRRLADHFEGLMASGELVRWKS